MKKIIYVMFVLGISALSAQAQTDAGSLMLGGGISYYSTKSGDYPDTGRKDTEVQFTPSLGYFISDNIAIGMGLQIGSYKEDPAGNNNNTTTSGFGVSPFARFYVPTSSDKFFFYAQVRLEYNSLKTEFEVGGDPVKGSEIDFAVSPGFAYFFNEHWSAELEFRGIGYNVYDQNKDDDNKNSTIEIGLQSLAPRIGVRYYF